MHNPVSEQHGDASSHPLELFTSIFSEIQFRPHCCPCMIGEFCPCSTRPTKPASWSNRSCARTREEVHIRNNHMLVGRFTILLIPVAYIPLPTRATPTL